MTSHGKPLPISLTALPPPPPSGVSINNIPGRGRALVAARPFRAGETVLKELPLLAVPMSGGSCTLACAQCFAFCGLCRRAPRLAAGRVEAGEAKARAVQCGACQCARCGELYCSVACRDAANQCGHKLLCASGPSAAAWQRLSARAGGCRAPRARPCGCDAGCAVVSTRAPLRSLLGSCRSLWPQCCEETLQAPRQPHTPYAT